MGNVALSMSVNNQYIVGPEFGDICGRLTDAAARKTFFYLFRNTKRASRKYGLGMELATIEPFRVEQLRPLIGVLRAEIHDLPITNAHLPYQVINIASINDGLRKNALDQQKKWIDFYGEIGAKNIVVHPIGSLANGKFGQLYGVLEWENAIANLFELRDAAASHEMVCGFENLAMAPSKRKKFKDRATFSTMDEIIAAVDQGLNVVWDTLHWCQSGYDLQEWIESGLLRRTILVHLVGGKRKHGKIAPNSQEVQVYHCLGDIPVTLEPDRYRDLRPSLVSLGLV